ncbi:MAG TPA: response regulator [Hyphomicrobiaceae bacterium]|nr:response regulator [Hyphomicrobiaceae bacterium]
MPAVDRNDAHRIVVLVVEDEPLVRLLMVEVLREAGFDVIEARTADEGMKLLDREGAIRAVVSDIETPGQHDGFALAWHARLRPSAKPVVLVSGQLVPAADELPSGTRFIQKPVDPPILVREVREAVLSQRAA